MLLNYYLISSYLKIYIINLEGLLLKILKLTKFFNE